MSSDELLDYLVQKTEETGVGTSLTLTVKGLYYDEIATMFRTESYTDKSEGKRVEHTFTYMSSDPIEREVYDNYRKDFEQFINKSRREQKDGTSKYIHHHNVEVRVSFSSEPFRMPYWRGLLSSVDGFLIGRLGTEANE